MLDGNRVKLGNSKSIEITALDARRLHVDISNVAFFTPKMDKDNGYIISLSLEDKLTFSMGDEIIVNIGKVKTVYTIRYIVIEKKGKSALLYSDLPTKTELFLVPILGRTPMFLRHTSYFAGAYLDHTHEYLCLKYRFTGTPVYKQFERDIMTDSLCISHLDHGKYHVIYFMKIPSGFKEDVLSLIEGKYSKFSKALRQRIRKFYGKEEVKPIMDIINQDINLRQSMEKYLGVTLFADSELASKPDLNIEIYKPYGTG